MIQTVATTAVPGHEEKDARRAEPLAMLHPKEHRTTPDPLHPIARADLSTALHSKTGENTPETGHVTTHAELSTSLHPQTRESTTESSPGRRPDLAQLFTLIDTEQNGWVGNVEFRAAFTGSREDANKAFTLFDRQGSGKILKKDFEHQLTQGQFSTHPVTWMDFVVGEPTFRAIATDGSKTIGKDQFEHAWAASSGRTRRNSAWAEVHKNDEGEVDLQTFSTALVTKVFSLEDLMVGMDTFNAIKTKGASGIQVKEFNNAWDTQRLPAEEAFELLKPDKNGNVFRAGFSDALKRGAISLDDFTVGSDLFFSLPRPAGERTDAKILLRASEFEKVYKGKDANVMFKRIDASGSGDIDKVEFSNALKHGLVNPHDFIARGSGAPNGGSGAPNMHDESWHPPLRAILTVVVALCCFSAPFVVWVTGACAWSKGSR